MKNLLYILSLFIFSCSTEVSNEIITEDIVIASKDIKADSKIVMEIEGMTCEMGCVATIRNRVTQMKGTTNFEMDFDVDRATDFATIQFDSRLLSKDDIKNEIEDIAQGLYSVIDTKELPLD